MAVTRLVRKALRNRAVSSRRVNNIKRLTAKPVIKNVDIEEIKEEFAAAKKAKPAAKKEVPVKEAPASTPKEEKAVAAAPEAEKAKEALKAESATKEETTAKTEEKKAAKKTPAEKAAPKAKKEASPKAEKKEDSKE